MARASGAVLLLAAAAALLLVAVGGARGADVTVDVFARGADRGVQLTLQSGAEWDEFVTAAARALNMTHVCGVHTTDLFAAEYFSDFASGDSLIFTDCAVTGRSTALVDAVRAGDDAAFVAALDGADTAVDETDGMGRTPLWHAAAVGRLDYATKLLERGADANRVDINRVSVGSAAVVNGAPLDMLALLQERGARFDILTDKGDSALQLALLGGHRDSAVWLLEHVDPALARLSRRDGFSALHAAASNDALADLVPRLLAAGAPANAALSQRNQPFNVGATPLHLAAQSGALRVMRALLDGGASPMSIGYYTAIAPLSLAASHGRLEAAQMLLAAGADAAWRHSDGSDAASLAVANGHAEVAALLRESVAAHPLSGPLDSRLLMRVSVTGPSAPAVFTLPRADHVFNVLLRGTYYESDLLSALASAQARGIYVDVGAHVGNHAVFFAKECPSDLVVAFEPHPANYELLRANVRDNDVSGRVLALNMAAHDTLARVKSVLRCSEPPCSHNIGQYAVEAAAVDDASASAPAARLDELLEPLLAATKLPVSLIKIDVEGGELAVLRSAATLLSRFRPILAVESATQAALDEASAFLQPLGYASRGQFALTPTFIWVHESADPEAAA